MTVLTITQNAPRMMSVMFAAATLGLWRSVISEVSSFRDSQLSFPVAQAPDESAA